MVKGNLEGKAPHKHPKSDSAVKRELPIWPAHITESNFKSQVTQLCFYN